MRIPRYIHLNGGFPNFFVLFLFFHARQRGLLLPFVLFISIFSILILECHYYTIVKWKIGQNYSLWFAVNSSVRGKTTKKRGWQWFVVQEFTLSRALWQYWTLESWLKNISRHLWHHWSPFKDKKIIETDCNNKS